MKLLSLFLAPTLALAGTFSGTVTLLDGTPVTGAVVKSLTDSVITTASGTFTVARASGISSRDTRTIPVTIHLRLEDGHPLLSFGGFDASGRPRASVSLTEANRGPGAAMLRRTARSTGGTDTLKVFWKGKRLTVLSAPSDSSVAIRIDTAWKDDAGIPWNPRIAYGSLLDSRDGQTYRTVTIGARTWMAENLNFKVDSSRHFRGIDTTEPVTTGTGFLDDSLGAKYGRYYDWIAATALPASCLETSCTPSRQGVCPTGWHLPDSAEWEGLRPDLGEATRSLSDTTFYLALKSVKGWGSQSALIVSNGNAPSQGIDLLGFRGLNSGYMAPPDTGVNQGFPWGWWSRSESSLRGAWAHGWNTPWHLMELAAGKNYSMPVRCLKD